MKACGRGGGDACRYAAAAAAVAAVGGPPAGLQRAEDALAL